MRTFESGAIRDDDDGKLDYEGCQSPLVMERYAQYMMKHCIQKDGQKRSTDNWQKGFGLCVLMKSMWRHLVAVWFMHRGLRTGDIEDSLCALKFNVDGYLYEVLKANHIKEGVTIVDLSRHTDINADYHPTGHTPEFKVNNAD